MKCGASGRSELASPRSHICTAPCAIVTSCGLVLDFAFVVARRTRITDAAGCLVLRGRRVHNLDRDRRAVAL
ncbi:hypothetical protein PENSPDRAFT_165127 [Peniophora sp. CONT]|nr:hypothetical protein PENSPDRAFT_165127 [Peniophora sp. CONT]